MPFMTYLEQVGFDKGLEKGLEKGQIQGQEKTLKETIVTILQTRFGNVDEQLQQRVQTLTDRALLQELVKMAVQCSSLTEFAQLLPAN